MSVKQQVLEIIVEQLGVDQSDVTPEKSFVDDLNADSLDVTEMIMSLEERFNVEISESEAENLRTVSDVIDYIEKKQTV